MGGLEGPRVEEFHRGSDLVSLDVAFHGPQHHQVSVHSESEHLDPLIREALVHAATDLLSPFVVPLTGRPSRRWGPPSTRECGIS